MFLIIKIPADLYYCSILLLYWLCLYLYYIKFKPTPDNNVVYSDYEGKPSIDDDFLFVVLFSIAAGFSLLYLIDKLYISSTSSNSP